MMKLSLTIALTLLCRLTFAQDTCNCLNNLNKTIDKVSNNYAGFNDKVKPENKQQYIDLVDSLRMIAAKNNYDGDCLVILKKYTAFFRDGHLGVSLLKKALPSDTKKRSPKPVIDNNIPSINFKGSKWAVITIPSFDIKYNDTIHALFKENNRRLEKTPNCIVDIRGNDGGAIDVYSPLLPYLYTDPIILYGAKTWCSPENVQAVRTNYEDYKDQVDSLTKIGWRRTVERMEANVGSWMSGEDDTLRFGEVKKFPRKMAILIDDGCASSSEIFILKARQSKKVTLFGTPSNGTVDYGDVMYWDDLPYQPFNLRIATIKWNWVDLLGPIDPSGIKPDIIIPTKTTDWVSYTMKHFN